MTTSNRAEVPRATRLSFWTPYAMAAPVVDTVKQAKQTGQRVSFAWWASRIDDTYLSQVPSDGRITMQSNPLVQSHSKQHVASEGGTPTAMSEAAEPALIHPMTPPTATRPEYALLIVTHDYSQLSVRWWSMHPSIPSPPLLTERGDWKLCELTGRVCLDLRGPSLLLVVRSSRDVVLMLYYYGVKERASLFRVITAWRIQNGRRWPKKGHVQIFHDGTLEAVDKLWDDMIENE